MNQPLAFVVSFCTSKGSFLLFCRRIDGLFKVKIFAWPLFSFIAFLHSQHRMHSMNITKFLLNASQLYKIYPLSLNQRAFMKAS